MDWEFLVKASMPPQGHLLHGCSLEAERADRVAAGLDGLRSAVAEPLHPHMVALAEEIRQSSQLLRELAECSRVYGSRAAIVVNHLNVILPCLSKTLRDITAHYEDKTTSREMRWRKMYHDMRNEAGGLLLPQRFMMYNHFLMLLLFLLTKDKNYDQGQLEYVRAKILDLRHRRGLPPPVQTPISPDRQQPVRPPPPARSYPYFPLPQPLPLPLPQFQPRPRRLPRQETMLVHIPSTEAVVGPVQPPPRQDETHWCEHVFSLPLVSRTPMKSTALTRRGSGTTTVESRAYPPFVPSWDKNRPHARRTLMRRSFDRGQLCVLFITSAEENAPLVAVKVWSSGTEWYAYRGHHELCIRRDGNKLVLKRWSHSKNCAKHWAVLSFPTWEELVLFYCAFMALKARNEFTVKISPSEHKLRHEKCLFRAQIIDDDYRHSLIVYQDSQTGGIRLHAAVWDGELHECPVWTVFVTHPTPLSGNNTTTSRLLPADDNRSENSTGTNGESWLEPRGRHKVWLHDVQLYVFCDKYHEASMRKNRKGAFEIDFVENEAAARFREVFYPPVSEPPSDHGRGEEAHKDESDEDIADSSSDDEEERRRERTAGPSSRAPSPTPSE